MFVLKKMKWQIYCRWADYKLKPGATETGSDPIPKCESQTPTWLINDKKLQTVNGNKQQV